MLRPASVILFALAGCGGGPTPAVRAQPPAALAPTQPVEDPLALDALMRDVAYLAGPELRGRGSATADEERAAAWLVAQTTKAGLAPLGELRVQPFTARADAPSRNVIGVLEVPRPIDERVVVVGAHYDHEGVKDGRTYWGADDNASGTAAVLGVARTLAAHRERAGRRIVFVFFGAEEQGLLGSFAFVHSRVLPPERVVAMINADMLGRPLQDQPAFRFAEKLVGIDAEHSIGVAGSEAWPWLDAIVKEACRSEGHRAIGVDDLPEIMRPAARRATTGRSDHHPFERVGIPSMIFSSGESVDYHQPTDTPATLRPALLATRARILLRTVVAASNATP